MDRERLQQVHGSDLTESRVNQDFVDWLKTKGMSWLLIVLIALCAYVLFIRLRERGEVKRAEAWVALRDAATPAGKEDVAAAHAGTFAVAHNAHLDAADLLLQAVAKSRFIQDLQAENNVNQPLAVLDDASRTEYLARALENFDAVVALDDGSFGHTLYAVQAHNGRAAVAEARGDGDAASAAFEEAAKRAEEHYPELAERIRNRAAATAVAAGEIELKPRTQIQLQAPLPEEREPASIDATLEELIFDDESDDETP